MPLPVLDAQPWLSSPAQFSLQARLTGGHLQILFPRRLAGTSELLYTPQVSRNLTDWATLTASFVSATPLANLPGFEQAVFQADPALTQESTLYMRLQVGFQ
jgi:hypothetical protein